MTLQISDKYRFSKEYLEGRLDIEKQKLNKYKEEGNLDYILNTASHMWPVEKDRFDHIDDYIEELIEFNKEAQQEVQRLIDIIMEDLTEYA